MATADQLRPDHEDRLSKSVRALRILEHIEQNPDATQADLASRLGVAVGTVNWYVRRLAAKGFVKITRLQRRRVRYLITPRGIAEKASLAYEYVRVSMHMYKTTRARARELVEQVRQAGYDRVSVEGDSDLVDVCRLTCLESGVRIQVVPEPTAPGLVVDGAAITLRLPGPAGEVPHG